MVVRTTAEELVDIGYQIAPSIILGLLFCFKTIGPFTLFQNLKGCGPRRKRDAAPRKPLFDLVGEEEIRRWAPVIMIGPLPVALLALIVASGGAVLFFTANPRTDACAALNTCLATAVCLAYMFLMTFFWSYWGYTYHLKFTLFRRPRNLTVLSPYPCLGHLIAHYLDLFFVGIAIVANYTMTLSATGAVCANYGLVVFSGVTIFIFWIQVCAVVYAIFKTMFGKEEVQLGLAASQALKARKAQEAKDREIAEEASVEERQERDAAETAKAEALKLPLSMQADATDSLGMQAVREQFMVIGNMDEIASTDLEELLTNLRLRLPEPDVDDAKEQLDLEGIITFDLFYEWYKAHYADKKKRESGDVAPSAPVDLSKDRNKPKEEKKGRFKSWGGKKDAKKVYAAGESPEKAPGDDAFAEMSRKTQAAPGSAAQGDGQATKKGRFGFGKKK